ncbi:hypothetical protein [Streptomyces sp. TRM64462]|uniref:hypothetical protein n=1 Tax=Streptomyces sp. TRM64462 TaxID=2741726 RepID=UPI0015868E0A|nr:hypothetical protein [Streptomyces sp. TRM64462]
MTSTIDELLSRARLVETPSAPADVSREPGLAPRPTAPDGGPVRGGGPARSLSRERMSGAAHDLQALCETLVTTAAVTSLSDFVTRVLPEPAGARVLGCILQLGDAEDSARFWWQYAAGAGDTAASYCLYLHHLALGEPDEATWWQDQAAAPAARQPAGPGHDGVAPPAARFTGPGRNIAADASLPTMLRVLRALKVKGSRTSGDTAHAGTAHAGTAHAETAHAGTATPDAATVGAVITYVAAAVRYVDDDLDLPLPHPGFTDRIRALTAPGPAGRTALPAGLPARSRSSAIAQAARRPVPRRPDPLHSGHGQAHPHPEPHPHPH